MSSLRHQRVRELLKRAIGEVLRRELSITEVGLVSVNDVGVSADLHSATAFIGLLGTTNQKRRAAELLASHRNHLQHLIGQSVTLKYTPRIHFVVDDSIEKGNRVLHIMDELKIPDTAPPDTET